MATATTSAIQVQTTRRDTILETLRSFMVDSLPVVPSEEDIYVPFLEMGANSLILMQIQRTVENTFGLKLELPQFFTELTTIDALASYIDEHLPDEERLSSSTSSASERPLEPQSSVQRIINFEAVPTNPINLPKIPPGEYSSELEQIFAQQLQLASQAVSQVVAQQLAFLRDNGVPVTTAPGQKIQTLPAKPEKLSGDVPLSAPKPKAARKSGFTQQALSPFEIRARGLSPQQQRHLETLIAKYAERTKTSKQLTQKYRLVLADSRASVGFRFTTKEMLYPLIGKRGKGSRIWDVDDNEYIDITMGFGVHLFGHHPPFIDEALQAEPEDVIQMGPRSPVVGEVAELIADLTGMERVTFTNSGTEAVMAALRLARAVTGRRKIVMFEGAYHGHSDETMGMVKIQDGVARTVPAAPGTPPGAVEDLAIVEYGTDQTLEWIQAHTHEVAAVIVEPIQSRNPVVQPREFLVELRKITRDADVVLIFDEMITGFRMHPRGIQGLWDIQADMATYGKVVGGGMPIGVVAGKARYMDGIDGGMWQYGDNSYPQAERVMFGGTFCQHPVAMTTALATLKYLRANSPGLQEHLNQRTEALVNTLNGVFKENEVPIQMAHFGSLFRFEFTQNLELFFYHMVLKGVYIWEWRNCFLSTAHTDEDLDFVIQAVRETIDDMRAGGFLPRKSVSSWADSGLAGLGVGSAAELEIIPPQPLIEAQKQLAVLAQISDAGSLAYTLCVTLRLQGPFRLTAMQAAVQKVVDRHEALRTAIKQDAQHILPSVTVEVPVIDFTGADNPEVEVRAWIDQEIQQPFDLSKAPLFRVRILKLKENLHWLVFRSHHILIDGLSIDIIIRELGMFYTAACTGKEIALAQPMQFREYVYWQIQQSFTSEMAGHEAYWLNRFSESVPVLDLPGDRPRPLVKSYQGNRIAVPLNADICAQMTRSGQQQGCTAFMMFLSAYTLLLHRLTGQDRIVVGIPAAGRSPKGSDTLVGYCTHLLVIESNLDKTQSFTEYLKTMRNILLEAYKHQDYPFANLINKLNLIRDASRSLLVSTAFNVDQPSAAPEMFELETAWLSQPIRYTAFDLIFNLTNIDGEMILECDYNTDVFHLETVERFIGYFQTLLAGIVDNPEQMVLELPLLSAAEQQKILVEFNATAAAYPHNKTVVDLFEEQTEKTPDNVAVVFQEKQHTYRELNVRANQIAHLLKDKHQIQPDDRVGLLLNRSAEMIAAILGVLKAGGAYVPIEPSYPADWIRQIIHDSYCKAVLSETEVLATVDVSGLPAEVEDLRQVRQEAITNPDVALSSSHLAYVIYTSGSTGVPKGVMITHQSVLNLIEGLRRHIYKHYPPEGLRVALLASYVFDASVQQIFAALLQGHSLVVVDEETRQNGRRLNRFLVDQQIDISDCTPALLALMAQADGIDQLKKRLKHLIVGGEAFPRDLALSFCSDGPRVQVSNVYGPTECCVDVTIFPVESPTNFQGTVVPIGKPLSNTKVFILDPLLNPVPIGVAGEICLSGAGLARGYLNQEELTKEKFIPHPFKPGERLYRTGDIGRWLPDGNIEFLGRNDHQVKIRGYRIELGEIEHCLRNHESVQEAVVLAKSFDSTDPHSKDLVAYVTAKDGLNVTTLRNHLKNRLPDYMMPSYFVQLEKFPLTASGKIDRRNLPNPAEAGMGLESEYVAPRDEVEQKLADIWQRVLGVNKVGIQDNFFELGGTSIKAIQTVNKIHKTLDVELKLGDFFAYPTIAELAHCLKVLQITNIPDVREADTEEIVI
jgi:amino acid adenylation domain-containing protein